MSAGYAVADPPDLADDGFEWPKMPLVFVYRDSEFKQGLRRETRQLAAIGAVAAVVVGGAAFLHLSGTIDAGELLRDLLGPRLYRSFLGLTWILAAVLVLGGIGWVVKTLSGGDDYGLEIHEEGVVWLRRQDDRYPVPWSAIGRIWKAPLADLECFELKEPMQVSNGAGKWTKIDVISFSQYEPDWRSGQIGLVLLRYAPHLLDVIPAER